ncbi:hypothetical protein D4768_17530 [Rhodococcus erythropolis]|nr:hypothetical protein D4768_17530 [Rhodococcus erythropolis]
MQAIFVNSGARVLFMYLSLPPVPPARTFARRQECGQKWADVPMARDKARIAGQLMSIQAVTWNCCGRQPSKFAHLFDNC